MMKKIDIISGHDEQAAEYDQQVREYKYFAHEALFGLNFEYVSPHDRLLDIGIGTGLGSLPFARAGMEIYGIDGSVEMLKMCKAKDFTKDLKQFDLQNLPLPYSDSFFNHVISCGVFHFFGDLQPMVKDVFRIIKQDGIFTFTVIAQTPEKEEKAVWRSPQGYSEIQTDWNINIFVHSKRYIEKILQDCGFDMLKEFKFFVWSGKDDIDDLYYSFVARKSVI